MYIYEQKGWPQFVWDSERLSELLMQVRHGQGRLMGRMESVGFSFREQLVVQTLTQDVVKSSEIEGEILDPAQVRSSVARRLGVEDAASSPVDRNIEGVVEMLLDATQKFDEPLKSERLFHWHTSLFPKGRSDFKKITVGGWRKGIVQVISGYGDKETIHFEAPAAKGVAHEMSLFLDWFNRKEPMDQVLKAALAHLWFVTIHPFDDGNGRIGRAIADLVLARSENSSRRFYSLSAQIQVERKGYYAILEQTQQGGLDVTPWIEWFLHCLIRAIDKALSTLEGVIHKTRIWESLAKISLNERQKKLIHRLVEGFSGKLTSSKWAQIAKCSQDTAHRDILDLIEKGVLVRNEEGGRSTSYSLSTQYLP